MNVRLDPDILPWSQEAEQSVIGCILADNRAFSSGHGIEAKHFFDVEHARIWRAIDGLLSAGKPVDLHTLVDALGDCDKGYIGALAGCVPSARNLKAYAATVKDKAADRALLETADAALSVAAEKAPVAEKIDRIATMFGELQKTQVRRMPRSISEIAIERTHLYEDLAAGKTVPGWPTRIPTLDLMLNGGLKPGKLYILAARPAVGKSSFSQALGLNLAGDGHPVLFLSQEMEAGEIADRSVANAGRLSYSALLTGKMKGDDWNRATDALEKLATLPFYVDDQPALKLLEIRAKARTCPGLQVLILDYLQLCSGSKKDGTRNAEIEEISRGLKTLAKEMGIAVIALSQLNRDVEKRANRRPNLSDLRDSGAIEQDADVVMFLWPVRDLNERKIVGLGADKNRQGRTGEFGLDFYGDTQRWNESTADIRPAPVPERKGGFE